MESIDTENMGIGTAAIVFVVAGFIAIVIGAIVGVFFWPLGLLFFVLGVLAIIGGPAIALLAWFRGRSSD